MRLQNARLLEQKNRGAQPVSVTVRQVIMTMFIGLQCTAEGVGCARVRRQVHDGDTHQERSEVLGLQRGLPQPRHREGRGAARVRGPGHRRHGAGEAGGQGAARPLE